MTVVLKQAPRPDADEPGGNEHFSWQHGFWRLYVEQVIYRYLDCGDLHNGFARLKMPSTSGNARFNSKQEVIDKVGEVNRSSI